jgi:hypothetical protein
MKVDEISEYADGLRLAVKAYRRIMKAAKAGRGVRLSVDEVWAISQDDAIATPAGNEWEFDERHEG